jgi:hypothetical protein
MVSFAPRVEDEVLEHPARDTAAAATMYANLFMAAGLTTTAVTPGDRITRPAAHGRRPE